MTWQVTPDGVVLLRPLWMHWMEDPIFWPPYKLRQQRPEYLFPYWTVNARRRAESHSGYNTTAESLDDNALHFRVQRVDSMPPTCDASRSGWHVRKINVDLSDAKQ